MPHLVLRLATLAEDNPEQALSIAKGKAKDLCAARQKTAAIFRGRKLKSHNLIAFSDYLVHILHSTYWTHFGAFLITPLDAGTTGKNSAAGF